MINYIKKNSIVIGYILTIISDTIFKFSEDLDLNSPIVIQPGEFIQLVAKNLGVVTTAGTVTFLVGFGGYWE